MQDTVFASRSRLLMLGFASLAVIIGLRLIYLQIVKHNHYSVLASEEQLRKYELAPNRGEIFVLDRGQPVPIVLNRKLQTLYGDPNYIDNPADIARKLADVTGDDPQLYQQLLEQDSAYVVLKRQLEPTLAKAIAELQLPGIGLNDAPIRVYPEGQLASQVLGFVNNEGIGQYGIEEQLNDVLDGNPGLLAAKTDTRGIPIATSDNVQLRPEDGNNVVLTIDRNIQAKVEQVISEGARRYQAKSASAIVMDPRSGRVLAMANYPSFDAANFSDVTDYSVFSNQAATGLYEPGSVFKVFTMSAGLNDGAINPQTTFDNTGATQVGDRRIENVADEAVRGVRTMTDAITYSLNTGVIEVLRKLGGGEINQGGKQKLYDYFANRFLFGRPTGIEAPGEPAGQINPPTSDDTNYANMTFGQGLTATMTQIVAAVSAIANGGTIYQPHLVDSIVGLDGRVINETVPTSLAQNVITPQTAEQVRAMMETVVEHGGGGSTKIAGYRIGGKTGTAQIPNPDGGYFDNRDVGSFLGIAPLDNPHFVMVVRADEPQIGRFAGSAAAAPMFGEIMKWLLSYEGVGPSR